MHLEGSEEDDQDISEEAAESEDEEFLVKFEGKSYLRTKWMTRDEIYEEVGMEVTPGMIKSMNLKIKKLEQLKLAKGLFFNPSFLQADRILSST